MWRRVAIYESKLAAPEIARYYSAHASEFERVEINVAGIRKRGKTGAGLSSQDASRRAGEIRKALASHTDISKVAAQFAVAGAVLIETRVAQRGEWPLEMEQAVFSRQDGGVFEAENTADTIVIVQVVRHIQPRLDEAMAAIESALHIRKLQATLKDLRSATRIWIDPEYF